MSEREADIVNNVGEKPSGEPQVEGEVYFPPNLVHPLDDDEQKALGRIDTNIIQAMKKNDIFPPDLLDPDGGLK